VIEWPECEADHSLSSRVTVNNEYSYTPSPPYAFIVWAGENTILILIPVSATGNPVQCDSQLVETITVMEGNYTKLYGLGHCLSMNHTASPAALSA
jgi:hypothetical protein